MQVDGCPFFQFCIASNVPTETLNFLHTPRREENDAHIITLNDESLGNRINSLKESTNHISERNDVIENTEGPKDKNQRSRR